MTPSKSKTIARRIKESKVASRKSTPRSLYSFVAFHFQLYLLAGANRDRQAILAWRVGTLVRLVVVAVRVVGAVEVHLVDVRAVGRQVQIAAGWGGLGAAWQGVEGNEEMLRVGHFDEHHQLALGAPHR